MPGSIKPLVIQTTVAFAVLLAIGSEVLAQSKTSFDDIVKKAQTNPEEAKEAFLNYAQKQPFDSTILAQYQELISQLRASKNFVLVNDLFDALLNQEPGSNEIEMYFELLKSHYTNLMRSNEFDSATLFIDRVYSLAVRENYPQYEAGALLTYSLLARSRGNTEEAFDYCFQALEVAILNKDTTYILGSYSNIVIRYFELDDLENAKKYADRAVRIKSETIPPIKYAQLFSNYGLLFSKLNKEDSAFWSFQQALKYAERAQDTFGKLVSNINMAMSLRKQGKIIESMARLDSIAPAVEEIDIRFMKAKVHENRALNYAALKDWNSAIQYGEKALAIWDEDESLEEVSSITENLSEWYEKKGLWQKALEYHKLFVIASDSLAAHSNERKIGEYQSREELIKSNYEKQLLANSLEFESKTKRNLLLLILVLALLGGGIFLLYLRTKKLSKVVALQRNDLQKLNTLKSEFFANISHELRTPLTLIQGNLESLEKANNVEIDQKQKVVKARRNAKQLTGMIDDLLDLSRLELGQFIMKQESVPLNLFVKRILSSFQSLSDECRIAMVFESNLPDTQTANLDQKQFEKVISNLLYNAFKFSSPDTTVRVALSVEGETVVILLADQGPGIPEADLPHIFERFYRSKTQADKEGTGLGLAITKEIIDRHGGTITAQSTKGKGSIFTIRIPKDDQEPKEEQLPLVDLPSANQLIREKFLKWQVDRPVVLIVEDNTEMQEYLSEILSQNFITHISSHGKAALKWLKENRPHLIISDAMMPEMDGFQLLEHLKKDPEMRQLPFIMLTARSGKDDRLKALRLAVDDYITKPFDQDELMIRSCNLIDNLQNRIHWNTSQAEEDVEILDKRLTAEDEELVRKLQDYVLENIKDTQLHIQDLADHVAMSERQLRRKLTASTGLSPNEFVMEVRLQRAYQLLVAGDVTKLAHLASEVGIGTPSYLTTQFFKRFGKKPSVFY